MTAIPSMTLTRLAQCIGVSGMILLSTHSHAGSFNKVKSLIFGKPEAVCEMPSGYQMKVAVPVALDTLGTARCQTFGHVDAVLENLMVVAEHDPGRQNRAYFNQVARYLVDNNLWSKKDAGSWHNSYFGTPMFVAATMGDDAEKQSCSIDQEQMKKNLGTELTKKERGLVRVLEDREGFQAAKDMKIDLELLLEAVQMERCEQY